LEIPLDRVAVVFATVKGAKGETVELKGAISPASERTIIGWKDALRLGYMPKFGTRGGGVQAITPAGIIEARPVKLDEIVIGDLRAREVESLAYELPDQAGVDLILGYTFLRNFRVTFDYPRRVLRLESPDGTA
jgi:predicted aspartyl protease